MLDLNYILNRPSEKNDTNKFSFFFSLSNTSKIKKKKLLNQNQK